MYFSQKDVTITKLSQDTAHDNNLSLTTLDHVW